MAKKPVPFLGPTYQNPYLNADGQRCVNWFPKGNILSPRPGFLDLSIDIGVGPFRGWILHKDYVVLVSGNTVFKLSSGLFPTTIGSIGTSSGSVWMASSGYDGEQVMITDGSKGYLWDESTLTEITDPEFPVNPSHVLFTDGYFVVLKGDSAEIHKPAAAYDGTNWDGEFATAEANPDRLLAAINNRNDLWLLGEKSLEVWYYSGESFPWNPNRSAFQMYGIQAPNSLVRIDNNLAWIARSDEISHTAVMTQGYAVTRISTTAIEREWRTYSTIDDARAFAMKYPGTGHFLVFQFPTADKTWVYDVEEKQWSEWEEWNQNPLAVGRFRGMFYIPFAGKHLIANEDKIYEISVDYFTDNGQSIVRKRMGPDLITMTHTMTFDEMELIMVKGTGGTTDPVVRMNYSDDRGVSWSNFQTASFGASGGRTVRTRFFRLGQSRERMFNLEASDACNTVLAGVVLDYKVGVH